jgi:hypothetical protein
MSEPFHQGREYLYALLYQLSRMRGVPSRYLQPLLEKTHSLRIQIPARWPLTTGWEPAIWNPRSENDEENQLVNVAPGCFTDCLS